MKKEAPIKKIKIKIVVVVLVVIVAVVVVYLKTLEHCLGVAGP